MNINLYLKNKIFLDFGFEKMGELHIPSLQSRSYLVCAVDPQRDVENRIVSYGIKNCIPWSITKFKRVCKL